MKAATSSGVPIAIAVDARRDALDQAASAPCRRRPRRAGRRRAPAMQRDAFAPAHRAGHLLDQPLADLGRVGDRRGQHIGDQRHGRRRRSATLASASAIASAAGCISGAMERRAHRQQHRALGALAPWRSRRARSTAALRAGDHDLAAAHCRWRPGRPRPAAASAATAARLLELEAEQRRHGAVADRHRLPAWPGRGCARAARRRAMRQRAGRGERRIFAERVAGDEGGVAA